MKFIPNKATPIEQLLTENNNYQSYKLLKRLVKEGLKEYKCEMPDCPCNSSLWRNEKISLELHHINGNHTDNRIENLQILCPNCHSLTNNYRGKNKSAQNESSEVEEG